MIAHVSGEIVEKFNGSVIVDVHGIGYEVQVPLGEYEHAALHETIKFYTYHHVREQSEELYGFSSLAGKKLFELLITVQGVGPKAALAILSLADSEHVRNAIANGDTVFVAKASGVGKKTAERVVVDLADKVGIPIGYGSETTQGGLAVNDEALEALMALGFTLADATKSLDGVDRTLSVSERVKQALKQ